MKSGRSLSGMRNDPCVPDEDREDVLLRGSAVMTEKGLLDGKRLLIVDDEPDVLDSLEASMPMCVVTKALSFADAKELFETQGFDLAILDIMGVNGYELLQIAKEKHVPAVMLTAHGLVPENLRKAQQEGAAYFVPKEEMARIGLFLKDVLEARQKGRSTWERWLERFEGYFDRKFGPEWQKKHGIKVK
jgi:CheY-like chemotaxis protein